MKLLTKTSGSYILISMVVFIISALILFHLLQRIFINQLDETLNEEKLLIEQTINFSDSVPDFRSVFGHMIDITILNNPHKKVGYIRDTLLYESEQGTFASYRHLFVENTSIKNRGYTINIYKPLNESEKLITEIMVSLALVFITLMVLLVFVNYFIARRVWIPFYRILNNLSHYDINNLEPLELTNSNIHEFNLLNQALDKMSKKINRDFINLKEFNENAAHELQTPLAIIKLKLELLVQKENLDENQLQLISSVFEATTRMSKLNQGLLLISKIENNQFSQTELINLKSVIENTLEHFEEMISHRELVVTKNLFTEVNLRINRVLAEILITNLISNAIKHNLSKGSISITLDAASLTIENTGPLLKTDPRNLFERFRKSDSIPDSVGLGLSIVQKIANLYQMKAEYLYSDGLHTLNIYFNAALSRISTES
jgi:signal transduction histidine kinase